MFESYLNKGLLKGKASGVKEYRLGEDYIDVRFHGSETIYRYTYILTGKDNVEKMKESAINGEGLNALINKVSRKKGTFEKNI